MNFRWYEKEYKRKYCLWQLNTKRTSIISAKILLQLKALRKKGLSNYVVK